MLLFVQAVTSPIAIAKSQCERETTALKAKAIKFTGGRLYEAGELYLGHGYKFNWRNYSPKFSKRIPVYLVLVTVEGTGLEDLRADGARTSKVYEPGSQDAPVSFAGKWKRLILPVHGTSSADEIRITPKKAGKHGVSWALVANSKACGERLISKVSPGDCPGERYCRSHGEG